MNLEPLTLAHDLSFPSGICQRPDCRLMAQDEHEAASPCPGRLDDALELDGPVVYVAEDGSVWTDKDEHAPELHVTPDGGVIFDDSTGWKLLRGYTGQYGYNGPIMHESEYIGGRLARDILAEPGHYAALVAEPLTCDDYALYGECEHDCSDTPTGWAIAHKPAQI